MQNATTTATMLGRKLKLVANAEVSTGGWAIGFSQQTLNGVLTVEVSLTPPPMDAFVTQAFENLSLDETIDVPAGVTKVLVFGPQESSQGRGAIAEFDL